MTVLETSNKKATSAVPEAKPVTVENFTRAETDLYFASTVKQGGFGKFHHYRQPTPIDRQSVIRMNRDTLYSAAVFDLEASPVTIILPDPGNRFMSMQVFNEDQHTIKVLYAPASYTLDLKNIGTRFVMVGIRTLVNASDPADLEKVHALQDAIKVDQRESGKFEIPNWDIESQKKIREALLVLGATLPDSKRMFGTPKDVDPIRFLVGSAMAWGGNPETEATYINVMPRRNDGKTVHRLTVKEVPVDAFWSISVYNEKGYFEPNPQNAYSINNLTAKKETDGSVTIQFGGCDANVSNCLPIVAGWNYIVRLYRPHKEVLDGSWKFPEAEPVQ